MKIKFVTFEVNMRVIYTLIATILSFSVTAQVVPKAKTKAERKAERKKMTLKEKIEDTLPVEIQLPNASVGPVGVRNVQTLEDAKKALDKIGEDGKEKVVSIKDGELVDEYGNRIDSEFNQVRESGKKSLEEAKKYVSQTLPSYGKETKKRLRSLKKEKKKEKLFDGKNYKDIAVTKKIWKRGSGNRLHYIEFYVLKEHQDPLRYRKTNTWYDEKNKRISEVLSRDTKTNSLLHGPYKEYRGNDLVKEGYYYLGSKDGRWMEYDRDFVLLNKEYYNKGFLADSQISYYDGDSTKIKEIIPYKFGEITGYYMKFYPDGTTEEEGEYDSGKKIKIWIEYYQGGNRRKRVTQHPSSFLDETESYVQIEYDENRKVIYENKKTN